MGLLTFNEKLCQLIDARLARDPLFEPSEVAVNIDLDGGVTYCWARQPGPLKLRRFERLVRKARRPTGRAANSTWAVPRHARRARSDHIQADRHRAGREATQTLLTRPDRPQAERS